MSTLLKQGIQFDAAAQELWCVAETDDVDELLRILPRVGDVDARNKHGMTALMRAAYHGHERMVRTLLEHGADPNLTRNDRFTALALAAFFGHTETVRILIEHGARTEVVTRCGTSAYMWAAARTFEEAARCLEPNASARRPAPARAPVPKAPPVLKVAQVPRPAPQAVAFPQAVTVSQVTPVSKVAPAREPAPVPETAPAPIPDPVSTATVVKTLKDPPEIWDLVHEVPRGFNARSAFLARLTSMNRTVAVCSLTGLLLLVACGVGLIVLRDSPANRVLPAAVSNQTASENVTTPAKAQEPPVGTSAVEGNSVPSDAASNHPRRGLTRQQRPRSFANDIVVEGSQSPEESATKPAAAAVSQVEKPKPSDPSVRNKSGNNLSPQLIAPPAQSATPKAKVIQWP
jgi:uncharacterized protein